MDFESPDVEKEFPGLYASEGGRKSNESDFSDGGDHDKPSKKDLLGRRKEKKEKKEKERGYAALEGESSPEEDTDTKSPSKSKKVKAFKFPTKSKEKREKSRDKEKVLEDAAKQKEHLEKEKKKEKEREKEKKEKEKREKLKEKDKEKEEKAKFKLESKEKLKDDKKEKSKDDKKEKTKEKEKEKVKDKDKDKVKDKEKDKVKEKDKDKKDKKLTKVPSTVTAGVPFEEIFTLGVALPIFGVPLQQSVERSRCHDDTGLPLVVRDSIDYLQAHGLKSNQLYRGEADRIKLQQLRKLYTDRGAVFPYHWDVPVACTMLKTFLSELPESILTQELHGQFEQVTALADAQKDIALTKLAATLPQCNHTLVGWLVRHFESVLANEQHNHVTMQMIATVMCPALNMSQNLLTLLVSKAEKLFPHVKLEKYVPPLATLPSTLPESAAELSSLLRSQESLLSQIHAEMHAGFTSPARDQQLWEAQRIVTQIKRKLRSLQKSVEPTSLPPQPSVEEKQPEEEPAQPVQPKTDTTQPTPETIPTTQTTIPTIPPPTTTTCTIPTIPPPPNSTISIRSSTISPNDAFQPEKRESPKPLQASETFTAEFEDNFDFEDKDIELTTPDAPDIPKPKLPKSDKPKLSDKEIIKLRLELENAEFLQLKSILQARINSEQFEIVKLRCAVAVKAKQDSISGKESKESSLVDDQELKQKLTREMAMLEQQRLSLINQIYEERVACTQLKIDLAMKELL